MEPSNIFEYEALAREKLPQPAYDYFAGGANDEITLRENHQAFDHIKILPRVLVDVSKRDTSTTVLGQKISFPVMVAPMALQKMAHPDGEVATARAIGATGTIMILSTLASSTIEEVAAAATGPLWFQLYFRDREMSKELVQRAEKVGFKAICLTVDVPELGRRERDVRNNFMLLGAGGAAGQMGPDASLNWKDVDWLRSITKLPMVLKGIHRAADAIRAVEHGAAGIVVSNHGGRQLDTVPAGIEMLPEIAEAVAHQIEVYVDGGIRRGTDILKALALGARAVLLGRPVLWGLAVNGEAGARRVIELLRDEFDLAMALAGCPTVKEIDRSLVKLPR
ncbi:alpha-hydroxy-acid oxidizing protein [Candidatus Acetothermia bacterium]|nr:alpha-hydroxy-acid oxidizing protein [Candidatus Acetothermia bacterium]